MFNIKIISLNKNTYFLFKFIAINLNKNENNCIFEAMKDILKLDYQDFLIIVTFFMFWVSTQFGQVIEDTIAYFFVLSLGIIHGANDLSILQKKDHKKNSYIKSLSFYLGIILVCIVSYLLLPFISILAFIILSAYHFGEQHLEKKLKDVSQWKVLLYLIYGLFIFFMLFNENISDTNSILSYLTHTTISKAIVNKILLVLSFLLFLSFSFLLLKKNDLKLNFVKEALYLTVLYLVFKSGSLIFGFAVYFVFWHSIPSIKDQINYLFGTHDTTSIKKYFKSALIYWALSIFGLVLGYFLLEESIFNTVLFLILFAVTAPHTWVMKQMKT